MSAALALMTLLLAASAGVGLWQWRRIRALEQRLRVTGTELERLQQSCALLAPAGVVQRVVSDGPDQAAEGKVVTALFVDLVGYTALSGGLAPPELAKVLNGYFQRVSDAVGEHRGHVSTFLGDGVLALFGAIEPNPWQCDDAVRAALAMRESMREYANALEREGLPGVAIGAGIHTGTGVVGLMGSDARREYMVVGRTVNVAARVQSLTRSLEADILVTAAVREAIDPRFALQEMPATPVKGLEEPLTTYALTGIREVDAAKG